MHYAVSLVEFFAVNFTLSDIISLWFILTWYIALFSSLLQYFFRYIFSINILENFSLQAILKIFFF